LRSHSMTDATALPADAKAAGPPRLTPLALVVLEETLRPDAAETIAFMREQEVDLKLISGDARATVTAVAYAVGVPREAGVVASSFSTSGKNPRSSISSASSSTTVRT